MFRSFSIRYFASVSFRTIENVQVALEEHIGNLRGNPNTKCVNESAEPRSMDFSKDQVVIPLASKNDDKFRLQYLCGQNSLRIGKILEDLDTFAVWLSYRHSHGTIPAVNNSLSPVTFVTACVDHITFDSNFDASPTSDIIMGGFVSWVGKSSLEVSMKCSQIIDKVPKRLLSSKFVMVARDADGNRSLRNVPLITTMEIEEYIIKKGALSQKLRRLNEDQSLINVPPNDREINILHNIFKQTIECGGHSVRGRILPEGHVWLHDARLSDAVVCYASEKNIYGKMFGGFLMKKAVELAWANAYMFSNERCQLCGVGDIAFRKSVEVGSLLLLRSQVCYNTDHQLQLIVDAEVIHVDGSKEITNTFNFTFHSNRKIPTVIPFSYSEGMLYLNAKKHFETFCKSQSDKDADSWQIKCK